MVFMGSVVTEKTPFCPFRGLLGFSKYEKRDSG